VVEEVAEDVPAVAEDIQDALLVRARLDLAERQGEDLFEPLQRHGLQLPPAGVQVHVVPDVVELHLGLEVQLLHGGDLLGRWARGPSSVGPPPPGDKATPGGPLTYERMLMYRPRMSHDTLSTTELLQRFQAVAEETRIELVRLLSGGERCVCELQAEMGAAQSRLSFHLRKLKDAGVVTGRRDGRWVYYSLVPGALEEMRAFLGEVKPEPWQGRGAGGESCCE
jgi:ArsR family transcriptional regulator